MTIIVLKTIGTGGDYATPQAHENAKPDDLTLNVISTTGAGSTTSAIQLNASASATTTAYVGNTLTIAGENRLITAYNSTTKVATVGVLNGSAAAFSSAPASGVSYTIGAVRWRGEILSGNTFTAAGPVLTVSGSITDANNYYEIAPAAGAGWRSGIGAGRYIPNGAYGVYLATLNGDAVVGNAVRLEEAYAKCSEMQIYSLGSSAGQPSPVYSSFTTAELESCLIYNVISNTCVDAAGGITARNTLFLNVGASTSFIQTTTGTNNATFENCGFFVASDVTPTTAVHNSNQAGTYTYKNCAAYGVNNVSTGGGGTYLGTNNYASATAVTGWTNTTYAAAGFVGTTAAANDYRITTGSPLKNAGLTLSSVPLDAFGTARPQGAAYDVGSHELAGGLAFTITPNNGHTAGARTINVNYTGAVTSATNPFTIASGPGAISAYVQDTSTTCHFTYTQAGVSITPTVFSDSVTATTQSYSNSAVAPGAPTIGTATAGVTSASVTFTVPADNGGAATTSFQATASPGGATASGATSPINITGLTVGTSTTISVTATTSAGTSPASAASNAVVPTAAASGGTLTLPPFKIDSLGLQVSLTGIVVYVETLTGTPIVTKTAQTTNASGICVVTDATIVAGQSYFVWVKLTDGSYGHNVVVAT